jgi:hypothetical protein
MGELPKLPKVLGLLILRQTLRVDLSVPSPSCSFVELSMILLMELAIHFVERLIPTAPKYFGQG